MPKKKLINKKLAKLVARKCRLCPAKIYDLLDCHRIIPGEDGGEYTEDNVVVICSNCHRLVHDNHIIIDRWYHSTAGRLLRIIRDGKEDFV